MTTTPQQHQERLQRLSGARGQGVCMRGLLHTAFTRITEAKPMDTCAYPRLGWSANTQGRTRL